PAQWVGTRFCLHTGLMTSETSDGTHPPSETHKKTAKDRDCYHFTTSCPPQLETYQADFICVALVAVTAAAAQEMLLAGSVFIAGRSEADMVRIYPFRMYSEIILQGGKY